MLADLLCPPFHFPPGLLSGALNQSYGEICMAVRAAHVGFTLQRWLVVRRQPCHDSKRVASSPRARASRSLVPTASPM